MTGGAPVRLEVHGLECSYGTTPALSGFDLRLPVGRIVALLGPNGAGKTTALRAMARLHRPDRGRVLLDGEEVWHHPHRWCARRVAYVSQTDRTFGPVTVEQAALLGRAPHRGWWLPFTADDRRVVHGVLDRLGLLPLRHRTLDTLSGGERRRALLARALVQEAEVLLLDEPTAHLDLRHQVELLELLRELTRDRGLAVVASFHDLNQASQHADAVVLLCAGEVLASGGVGEVLTAETLHRAYGLTVDVTPHPETGIPTVLPARPTAASAPGAASAASHPTLAERSHP